MFLLHFFCLTFATQPDTSGLVLGQSWSRQRTGQVIVTRAELPAVTLPRALAELGYRSLAGQYSVQGQKTLDAGQFLLLCSEPHPMPGIADSFSSHSTVTGSSQKLSRAGQLSSVSPSHANGIEGFRKETLPSGIKHELCPVPQTLPCRESGSQSLVINLGKSKVPSGRGFGFSKPPSCMSSKAKETFKTWKEKYSACVIAHSFLGPWGFWTFPGKWRSQHYSQRGRGQPKMRP